MSFRVYLYESDADRRYLDKTEWLVDIYKDGYVCDLIDANSIVNPTIRIQNTKNVSMKTLTRANYAYIPELRRYYFIDNIVILSNQQIQYSLSVDVLMTYKDGIIGLVAHIDRGQANYNRMIPDNLVTFEAGYDVINHGDVSNTVFTGTGCYMLQGLGVAVE